MGAHWVPRQRDCNYGVAAFYYHGCSHAAPASLQSFSHLEYNLHQSHVDPLAVTGSYQELQTLLCLGAFAQASILVNLSHVASLLLLQQITTSLEGGKHTHTHIYYLTVLEVQKSSTGLHDSMRALGSDPFPHLSEAISIPWLTAPSYIFKDSNSNFGSSHHIPLTIPLSLHLPWTIVRKGRFSIFKDSCDKTGQNPDQSPHLRSLILVTCTKSLFFSVRLGIRTQTSSGDEENIILPPTPRKFLHFQDSSQTSLLQHFPVPSPEQGVCLCSQYFENTLLLYALPQYFGVIGLDNC